MPHCVYNLQCASTPLANFKGRLLCLEHAKVIKDRISRIFSEIEKRENRLIPIDEKIGINSPRYIMDSSKRVVKVRGQHTTISKQELEAMLA